VNTTRANALLTTLGENPVTWDVTIAEIETRRVTLANAPELPLGSPVKLRYLDCLWLGEVIECHPGSAAAIEVVHSLNNIEELAHLAELFLGKREAEPVHSWTATLS
jgi:hypothetical protein